MSLALLIAGSAQAFTMPWLRMAYFPFLLSLTAFYEQKTVLSVLLLIPFLELGNLLRGAPFIDETMFILFLVMTVCLSMLLKKRMKRGSINAPLPEETGAALSPYPETELNTLSDGKVISHYLESMFKPDDEIRSLLMVAKSAVFADSVNIFISSCDGLRLRCSTEESGGIIPSNNGILRLCFEERKPFISSDMNERKLEAGYVKKDKISSLVVVPVLDDTFPLGVITADSARFHAFSSADSDILQMFSKEIVKILQRERVYPQIQRSYATLKILNEESSKLLASLNLNVIVQSLIDGVYRIAPSNVVFFTAKGRDVEILHGKGFFPREKKIFGMKGTLLDMAVKNKGPMYISDVRNYRSPIMPFKTENVNAVFVLPMFYERDLLGILTLLLENKNALSPYQTDLLAVLGNQASTSMANAKFHSEIERLAVTDGLTGLFNHRHFQERLAQELSRLDRLSGRLSLLLIDIDNFKKINDTYGHQVGDSVLIRVAALAKKTARNIDIPARYGGEEFAVVLLGTDEKGAMNMAERLRKTVMDTKFSSEMNTFNVTVSIGISTSAEDVKKKEELIERADKALYHAKGSGRNRSILWSKINGNNS